MKEQVGKVTLDYSFYPGEDFYCDGEVEDELLAIVKENETSEFTRIIEEKKSWPILYHLSPLRGNIVEWFPVKNGAKVLEVGSGCGAITGTLAKKSAELTCIDLSKKRSLINAYRNKECDNVTIRVGNFKDIEPDLTNDYDYIFLIGVLEYGQLYIASESPYVDFIKILRKHLKPEGQLVIAIENKYGLKYWAGCREDHLGTFFSGIENYPGKEGIRTFTRNGLEKILDKAGATNRSFYYPYPDYKFMNTIYSDSYLPKKGELSNNIRNFDRSRVLLFDEKEAFDGIIEENLFSLYSNSYLVVVGNDVPIKYVKYSNDRKPECCIRTQIIQDQKEDFVVQKCATNEQAEKHIQGIYRSYQLLSKRFENSDLKINECETGENGITFAFLNGKTLEELLDDCLDRKDEENFEKLIQRYLDIISYNQNEKVTDLDLIFANILVEKDTWTVIDYEWTIEENVPTKEVAFRAFYCYLIGATRRRDISFRLMEKYLEIKETELAPWLDKEIAFQKQVTGNRQSLVEVRNGIGNEVYHIDDLIRVDESGLYQKRIQIYEDFGDGFSEQNSYFLSPAQAQREKQVDADSFRVNLEMKPQVKMLRIDPAFNSCLVEFESVKLDGSSVLLQNKKVKLNGDLIFENVCLYASSDPHIMLDVKDVKHVELVMKVTMLSTNVASELSQLMNEKNKNKGLRGLFK